MKSWTRAIAGEKIIRIAINQPKRAIPPTSTDLAHGMKAKTEKMVMAKRYHLSPESIEKNCDILISTI